MNRNSTRPAQKLLCLQSRLPKSEKYRTERALFFCLRLFFFSHDFGFHFVLCLQTRLLTREKYRDERAPFFFLLGILSCKTCPSTRVIMQTVHANCGPTGKLSCKPWPSRTVIMQTVVQQESYHANSGTARQLSCKLCSSRKITMQSLAQQDIYHKKTMQHPDLLHITNQITEPSSYTPGYHA